MGWALQPDLNRFVDRIYRRDKDGGRMVSRTDDFICG